MILEAILNLFKTLIFSLFSGLEVPPMPEEVYNSFLEFLDLLSSGVSFIGFFLPARVIVPFFGIFIAVYIVEHAYPVIMWVVRKIPFLGIE